MELRDIFPAGSYKGREHGAWSGVIFSRRDLIRAESIEHGAWSMEHGAPGSYTRRDLIRAESMEQRAWSAGFLYPAGSYKGREHGAESMERRDIFPT
jgi:hypothetical protein